MDTKASNYSIFSILVQSLSKTGLFFLDWKALARVKSLMGLFWSLTSSFKLLTTFLKRKKQKLFPVHFLFLTTFCSVMYGAKSGSLSTHLKSLMTTFTIMWYGTRSIFLTHKSMSLRESWSYVWPTSQSSVSEKMWEELSVRI